MSPLPASYLLAPVEPVLQPIIINIPDPRPVLPGPFGQAVIAGQGVAVRADIGCTLDIVMAAEDIGPASRFSYVAERPAAIRRKSW